MAKSTAARKPANNEPLQRDVTPPPATKGANVVHVWDQGAKEIDHKGATLRRVHTIEGKRYALSAYESEPCEVPMEHAVFFLKETQFIVKTLDGIRLMPTRPTTSTRGIKLEKNETIATYAELTTESLLRRAKSLPNGLINTIKTPREQLISFIMAGGQTHELVEDTDGGKSRSGVEAEMDDDGDPTFADKVLGQTAPGSRNMPESADGDLDLGE
jgi:hypothetical protein